MTYLVNYQTKNTLRGIMGIPIHRFVPCRGGDGVTNILIK